MPNKMIENFPMTATRFQAWIEGRAPNTNDPGLIDAAVSDNATKEQIFNLNLREDAILFAPEILVEKFSSTTRAKVIGYSGQLADTGTEISIGDELLVQFESYSTVEYLSIVCPTCVTIVDDIDIRLLKTDVDEAKKTGVFPSHLISPLITFVGLAEILALNPATGESRLTDVVRTELAGDSGKITQRFIAAVRALQLASTRISGELKVSGFGSDILKEPGINLAPDAPFILQAKNNTYYVADIHLNRFGAVEPPVAQIIESIYSQLNPPKFALDMLGISKWGKTEKKALFDKLGLQLPRSGYSSDH